MKTGMALSRFFISAISPEKKANTPQRPAMIVKTAGIGSLKKLGLSKGPLTIVMDRPRIKNRTNNKIANIEYLPNLLFGMKRSFIFIFLISLMLSSN
jgi:hypothetical protein